MRTLTLLVLLALLPVPAAAQVSAEHIFRPGAASVSVLAGGAAFSAFQYSAVDPVEARPYDRRIAAQTSPVLGAEFMVWLSPSWGMRLHGSWMPSRFDVQLDEAGAAHMRLLGVPVGDSTRWRALDVWVADAAALVRPHFTFGRVAPWLMLGGGVVSYHPRGRGPVPEEAVAPFRDGGRTALAGMVGVGAAVPLQREDFVLSFSLTNHITRTPIAATPERVRFMSHVRLLVGLTIPLQHQD